MDSVGLGEDSSQWAQEVKGQEAIRTHFELP
jgi:hypothetical protein